MTVRADWRLLAACIGLPELFYTDKYLIEAQRICNGCPYNGTVKQHVESTNGSPTKPIRVFGPANIGRLGTM